MAIIKSKLEISKIERACNETDVIFSSIIKYVKKNKKVLTEINLRDFILDEIKARGLRPSFPPIVTSGKRAGSEIHPKSWDSKLAGFVIVDFGVIYEKYMSDMTRMLYVGKPTKEEIDLYNKLLSVQEECVSLARSGVKACLLDSHARALLGEHRKYFIHTLGHGVGTKIHENPKIFYKLNKPNLQTGMVITIEPGLYIKGKCGLRIEDTILVKENGSKVLTKSNKKLIVIKNT